MKLATLLGAFAGHKLDEGHARLVRHGHLPEREILTGAGPVALKIPRVRDRKPGADKTTFTPSILPRNLRKAKSVEEPLPWVSTLLSATQHMAGREAASAMAPRPRGRCSGASRTASRRPPA